MGHFNLRQLWNGFKLKIPDKKALGFGALGVLLVVGSVSFFNTLRFIDVSRHVSRSYQLIARLEGILTIVSDAEDSGRNFLASGRESQLAATKNTENLASSELNKIAILTRSSASQNERFLKLKPLVLQRFAQIKKAVDQRKTQGAEAVKKEISQDSELDERIRKAVREMQTEEARFLSLQAAKEKTSASLAVNFILIGNLAAFLFTAISIVSLSVDIAARRRVEEKFKDASKKLQVWVDDLEMRNREFSILTETGDLLHTCVNPEEAYGVISKSCQKLFPDMQGALYLINESKNLVEVASEWNGPLSGESVFQSDDCWALRRGRLYEVEFSSGKTVCDHLSGVVFEGYLCVPMMGQGAALGFLHLRSVKDQKPDGSSGQGLASFSESRRRLVLTFAEQAALALANLRLRETLHDQSVRDPLTGLFNRRFMERSLERELRRSGRNSKPMGMLLLDVDRFKKFNDVFGHELGDQLLVEMGQLIQRHIRDYDIPCRYGGEEFLILLPEATLDVAQRRAEQLRKEVKRMQLQSQGKMVGPISVSLGVAIFPAHGDTSEKLFRAADAALYKAKADGRDCVAVAGASLDKPGFR